MISRFIGLFLAIASILLPGFRGSAGNLPPIHTVFIIVLENSDWQYVFHQPTDPYINSLLPSASFCTQYYNPPGVHPSEPNYIWLESGTNFGITTDTDPFTSHQNTTNHLTTLLKNAGISWKCYAEDISGTYHPLADTNKYAVRHVSFVYFDDVTDTNDYASPYAIAHIRPYTELAGDLASNSVAQYNFILPNLCDDMHDTCPPINDGHLQGNLWLSNQIPMLTNSLAFKNNGAIFITWDEGAVADGPIGMIVLSPLAKGGGYAGTNHYTHSSTLRTMQDIFGVQPYIRDAANATNLSDLFVAPPTNTFSGFGVMSFAKTPGGAFQLNVGGATPGKTNLVQISTDLSNWASISTNIPATNTFTVTDPSATNANRRFYRVVQLP